MPATDAAPESDATEPRSGSFRSLVGALAHDIDEILPSGDVAELRRMRPDDPGSAAFWKLVAARLEPREALVGDGQLRERLERQWVVILAAMAMLQGLHRPGVPLGRALADAGVAEQRVLRLLRAHDDALEDAVRVTTHQIATSGARLDASELALLVLSDGRSDEETVRRRVARHYYRHATT